ncbi:MAG: UDP-N-acetylglucosamine 2-epimerase (non-hydrolyzing) [Actinomycetaceae bacterium]|nr:UDP-N-acetylglucosamine 2-epimerase (non-hydrolyzing) [Actinomycetaceae bacterium]
MKVAIVYGTRPEAVKVAPLILALEDHKGFDPVVVSTGQHKEMMKQVNDWFELKPHYELDVFQSGQSLNELIGKVIRQVEDFLQEVEPDALLIQGDTTTVLGAALAAFYHTNQKKIPVIHLEAGLRSHDIDSPYPEEANRRLVTQIAALNLAPTETARMNLLDEGNDDALIQITGNTVIDALYYTVNKPVTFTDPRLTQLVDEDTPYILVTCHRRENWGKPMHRIAIALRKLTEKLPDYNIVLPLHGNPDIRELFYKELGTTDRVILTDSLPYPQFCHAMKHADLIISDSGGVQEEAPSLGKPVLVLRENTERPEAVAAGTVKLVGTDTQRIIDEAYTLLTDKDAYAAMAHKENPFGDGNAAEKCIHAIEKLLL